MSDRALEDARLLRLIRASFTASHGIYGAPRVFLDLRERGEACSKHRVARLMRENGLHALHGYRIRHIPVAKPHALIPNVLQRQFTVSKPNEAWVTDGFYPVSADGLPPPVSASRTQRVSMFGLTPTSRAIWRQLDFDRRTSSTSSCLYSGL